MVKNNDESEEKKEKKERAREYHVKGAVMAGPSHPIQVIGEKKLRSTGVIAAGSKVKLDPKHAITKKWLDMGRIK